MPSIKKNSVLENNEDNIIRASKKITKTSLRNMPVQATEINGLAPPSAPKMTMFKTSQTANAARNPDMAIRSAVVSEDQVKEYSNEFIAMLDLILATLLKLITYQREGTIANRASEDPIYFEELHGRHIPVPSKYVVGSGRTKGSKNKPKPETASHPKISQFFAPSLWQATNNEDDMESKEVEEDLQGAEEPPRFFSNMSETAKKAPPSQAYSSLSDLARIARVQRSMNGDDDRSEHDTIPPSEYGSDGEIPHFRLYGNAERFNPPSDDGSDSSSSGSDGGSDSGSDSGSDIEDAYHDFSRRAPQPSPLVDIIIQLLTLLNKADAYYNGRVRKNINSIDRVDIDTITNRLENIVIQFNRINHEYLVIHIENGSQLFGSLFKAFDKFRTDVLSGLKGYSPARRGGAMTYGSVPTHFNSVIRKIPTKYLL